MSDIDSSSKTPNSGVNWRSIFNSEDWSRRFNSLSATWKFIVLFVLSFFFGQLVCWIFSYLLPIYEPFLQIIISASVSFQESTLSLGFQLYSHESALSYEYIKVSVGEGIMFSDKFSTTEVIRSFIQPPENITSINSTIAMGSWPRYNDTYLIQLDRKMAGYGLIFKTEVNLEFEYTACDRPHRTYTAHHLCREVIVGFHPNATQGILMRAPVKCWRNFLI